MRIYFGNTINRSPMTLIVSNPKILGGKPCVKGTRISVDMILEWIGSGATEADIVKNYPHLTVEAVREAVRYAARYLHNEIVIEVSI